VTLWKQQIAKWVHTACLLEVLSPKPGNVSPASEFRDASVDDFLKSAAAIAPEMSLAETRPLGETILQAVQATRAVVGHNTNLGIILLIAPLAAVRPEQSLFDGVPDILRRTTVADSQSVYRAIRLAQPAGLGEVTDQDLQSEPSETLQECMRLAADRDLIAAQYANGFQQVLHCGLEWLREAPGIADSQQAQIVWLAVRILSEFGDSLIARKCGEEVSHAVREKAKSLLRSGWPAKGESADGLAELDAFLRADGNRRNPGTTADLVAAILFAALREGWFAPDDSWTAL
jgi:triphosphoribosyl-dephospho-CoA synthase